MGVRYRFGQHVLDIDARELYREGIATPMPARMFECLSCLIEARERAVGRDELVRAVFGRTAVSDAQLAQIVLRTRRTLGDDGQEQRTIRTVPRYGFRWVAPIEMLDDAAMEIAPASKRIGAGAASDPAPSASMPEPASIGRALPPSRHGWRFWVAGASTIAVVVALALAWHLARDDARSGAMTGEERGPRAVVVLPIDIDGDADAAWARLGLMDFVGERLRRGGLPVPSSENVLGVVHAQGVDVDPARLRVALRAAWLIEGRAQRAGAHWTVTLTARHADGTSQRAQGRDADLIDAARLAVDRLSAALGGRAPATPGETPALSERLQRARVAMLANEIDAARRILLAAPELQRAQPRLRYQLARVDFRAGEHARGLATLDAVLADAAVRRDPVFHAQVLNARGAMLVRLDRLDEARLAYDRAIALAGDDHPTELGVALSGRAVTRAMRQDYVGALADFGRARARLDASGDVLAVARVDGNVGTLEVDRGRPAQGLPFLAGAIDAFARMGAINELVTVRNVRTAAHLQLLQHDAALAESARTWALMPRIADRAQRADAVLTRTEALLAAGRLREAGRLLALPDAAHALPSDHGRHAYLQVELARLGGAGPQAAALADATLRDWPREHNPRLRDWLRLRREQAAPGGDHRPQDGEVSASDSVPAQLAQALARGARGELEAADAGYRAALASAERRGVPMELAETVAAYADWLLALGRNEEAAVVLGRVAPWTGADFTLALVEARIARTQGRHDAWQAAWRRANALAGERSLPYGLASPEAPAAQ